MIRSSSLYDVCSELFACYPPAVSTADRSGAIHIMLLLLEDGDTARYFVLSRDRRADRPLYSLRPRRTRDVVDIEAEANRVVPDVVVNAVTRGIPIPRDGSLFGWGCGDTVNALVPLYTTSTPASPDPFWLVMPHTNVPEAEWPPFFEERLLGHWFWKYYRAGKIISLGDLIAETPDTVFWTNANAILGSACCAVARDLKSPKGHTLRRGVYVPYQALRDGEPLPSLGALIADTGTIDLAPRFRRFAYSNGK